MDPQLHAIGMDMPPTDLVRAILTAGMRGRRNVAEFDSTALYVDPSGAKVVLTKTKHGSIINAGISGTPSLAAEVFRIGNTLCQVDLVDRHHNVTNRFLAQIDDPGIFPLYPLNNIGRPKRSLIHVGALGYNVKLYATIDAYTRAQKEQGISPVLGTHVIAPWMGPLYSGKVMQAEGFGMANFAGICQRAQLRTNQLTGKEFWYIQADCGFSVTVAVPADEVTSVANGNVLAGNFVMVASDGKLESQTRAKL